ncbi:MAG: SpoIIE family protein phosphatase [Candidatus Cloacimonetes bacterium]|nr:SpoIIE family protein phosphatase [Candidatus Cloacimonadota bacterium]
MAHARRPLLLLSLLFSGLCTQFGAAPSVCWALNGLALLAAAWVFASGTRIGRLLPLATMLAVLLEIAQSQTESTVVLALSPLVLAAMRALVLGGWLGLLWRERQSPGYPHQRVRRILFPFLALLGLSFGVPILVWPLVNLPLRFWMKREKVQWRLFLQSQLLLWLLVLTVLPLPSPLALPEGSLPNVQDQLAWWVLPAFLQSVLVYTGRFIINARIRSKLLATFALSSLVPICVLGILVTTSGFVLMGGYRANLVKVQLHERARVASMVTRWLMESFADLQQGSLGEFESKMRSIAEDEDMSKVFFGLYLLESRSDSSSSWRPLQASWRMPSTLFTRPVDLPDSLGNAVEGCYLGVDGRLYAVSMVRSNQVMILGYLPVDQELLQEVGQMLGVEILIRQLRREDLLGYSASHINLISQPVPQQEITRTPEYIDSNGLALARLFALGMARLEPGALVLGDPQDVFVIHVETTPGKILSSVFSGQGQDNLIYIALLAIQLLVLMPLFLLASWVAFLTGRRITRSVDELREGTLRLGAGEFGVPIPVDTGDELGDLAGSFNRMSERIQDSIASLAEKERMDQELAIARNIQRGLLPEVAPEWGEMEFAAENVPALEVGGDYYDWRVTSTGNLAFVLGDVSGKGVSAALLMANVQAAWNVLVGEGLPPERLARRLNRHLCRVSGDDMFVTLFHAELVKEPGQQGVLLRWCNCGHNPPLLVRRGELIELSQGGMLLGMFPEVDFDTGQIQLEAGDLLLMYTDGLTETQNSAEEEFGEFRLHKLLEGGLPDRADAVIQLLVNRLKDFNGGESYGDDLTMVVLRCPRKGCEGEPDEAV